MIPYLAFVTFTAAFGWTLLLAGKRNKHRHSIPTHVRIRFSYQHGKYKRKEYHSMPVPLQVNETKTATAVVFDQFGDEFPFDFSANPPSWTVDQPSTVGIGAGSQPQDELVTGLAPTNLDAVLSVSVPGVVNPTASETITVVAAPPPVPVPTSVQIRFS
jgi:hypothetical protein